MNAAHRLFLLALLLGALVAVGGVLSPSHREAVGALLMIGTFPVWVGAQLLRRKG